jgi:NAD(P)-dependent dehydrogenase (short-subunit alcohol dehydrogenase family)
MVATNPGQLDGRVVLLTGASGHLGRPMANAILDCGAELIISGRNAEKLRLVRDQHDAEVRARCHIVVGDLASPDGVLKLSEELSKRFESLHGVVNNAYFGRVGSLDAIEAGDFLLASQLNVIAPFLLVRELLPQLEKGSTEVAGGASVVNIASMYGSVSPDPSVYSDPSTSNPIHYGSSKAGLIQLTRYLACHLGSRGVRVNSVSPGPFPRTAGDPSSVEFIGRLSKKVPMGRVGRAEEIAGPVLFLLSSAASYVNGIDLAVDGGWTAW